MKNNSEEILQKMVCEFLSIKYPDVLFNVDLSGIRLTPGQAKKAAKLRSGRAFPDMVIYEPNANYNGLFFEFKKESPFKANGELKKQKAYRTVKGVKIEFDHLQEQQEMINKLSDRNYLAMFVWDFDTAKEIIKDYLKW